jgi:hypothetical protein
LPAQQVFTIPISWVYVSRNHMPDWHSHASLPGSRKGGVMSEPKLVYLSGGPFIDTLLWPAPDEEDAEQVKVPWGNGYEHYALTEDSIEMNGRPVPVYRWTRRTFIAE